MNQLILITFILFGISGFALPIHNVMNGRAANFKDSADLPNNFVFPGSVNVVSNGGALNAKVGDIDNDGDVELVTAASTSSVRPHLEIHNWNGSGFTSYGVVPPSFFSAAQDRFGTELSIADIDGDGFKDIITGDTSNGGTAGVFYWFKNPGILNGTWTTNIITTFTGSGIGNQVTHAEQAVDDVNGDGHNDVVIRDISHGFWVIIQALPFDGTSWGSRRFVAANPREGLTLYDIDADGDLDIFLNGVWFETPSDPIGGIYMQHSILGPCTNWYPNSVTTDTINDYACKIAVVDLNGDDKADFLISNAEELTGNSSTKPRGIRLYLQPADRINDPWPEVVLISTNRSWHTLTLGDVDRDGNIDVFSGISQVGVGGEVANIILLRNNGSAFFTQTNIASSYIYYGQLGDADGDGDLDIFAPENWNSGPVRYFQNTDTIPFEEPKLQIIRDGTNVVVSWLVDFSSYSLQTTPELVEQGTNWVTYLGPLATNAGKIAVTNNIETNLFYRLKL